MNIICTRNKGYKWNTDGHSWFKGYIQYDSGEVLRDEAIFSCLKALNSFGDLKNLLSNVGGIFQLIIKHNNEVWLATDISRSMPIYYTNDLSIVTDDVSNIPIQYKDGDSQLDPIRALELYTTSFVGFKNTVYKRIKQVEIGSVACIVNNNIIEEPYFIHGGKQIDIDESDALKKIREITNAMISRITNVVNGRTIVLSLSGGYDSRYLACSLKDNGIDNVICYTYGKTDSFEVIQSKKVADALGYEWHNIEYTDEVVKCVLDEDKAYFDYSDRPDYSIYLQNYIAVKSLVAKGIIPCNSVFLTGLCNDMPTGFYIPSKEDAEQFGFSLEGVADYNLRKRFVKFSLTDEALSVYKNDIIDFFSRMHIIVNDYYSFVEALDCLETVHFHSHCYLNMNVVHEFFGYEWILPCWDRHLLNFWYSLPVEFRSGQYLYERYITEQIGAKYGVGTKKHINYLARTPRMAKIKRAIGGIVVEVAYPLGIPLRRNRDINNFSVLEVKLYKNIKQKKAVKADRAAIVLMLTIYMMEYRYGKTWYSLVKQYLSKKE